MRKRALLAALVVTACGHEPDLAGTWRGKASAEDGSTRDVVLTLTRGTTMNRTAVYTGTLTEDGVEQGVAVAGLTGDYVSFYSLTPRSCGRPGGTAPEMYSGEGGLGSDRLFIRYYNAKCEPRVTADVTLFK